MAEVANLRRNDIVLDISVVPLVPVGEKMGISIKVRGGEYKNFEVPEEVRIYIMQLESAIITKDFTGVERAYPERFKKERDGWDV
jgi:hypothetical protein